MTTDTPSRSPRLPPRNRDLSPPLGERDIHIFTVPLAAQAEHVTRLAGLLSPAELAAMQRFAFADDRRRYLLAHVALRQILAAYLVSGPARIELRRDPLGKPYIVGTDIHCSLAHAADLAVIAVGRQRPLGIDLEPIRKLPDADALKRSYFTARERAHLDASASDRELLRLWTRKEAAVKASGEGLRRALAELDVLDPLAAPPWRIVDLALAAGYVGAAAVRADVARLQTAVFKVHAPDSAGGSARSGLCSAQTDPLPLPLR